MPHRSLADFLEELGQAGELVRVDAQVDPCLEVAEITRRIARADGPALLFASQKGHDLPLVTNLLGTPGRIERALGASLAETAQRIGLAVVASQSEGWMERLKTGPHESAIRRYRPRSVKSGACQQVVRLGSDVDLRRLPALQSGQAEQGPTITAGQLWMLDPDGSRTVIDLVDLPVLDAQRLAVFLSPHQEPARLLAKAREPVPAAVVLGGDPVGLLASAAPLPPGFDAAALAGLLAERPVDLVRCRAVALEVPAEADFVLEGFLYPAETELVVKGSLDPAEPAVEAGPLVTPAGSYAPARRVPVMRVTAITHRGNPVFPALVPGDPSNEACQIARAMRRILLPLVRLAIPELVDYNLPMFGAVRNWAVVAIDKSYPGQARKVAEAAWGYAPLMVSRLLVIVDAGVDIGNAVSVLQAVSHWCDPGRDVMAFDGPADPWLTDPQRVGLTSRLAIDATRKLPGETRGADRVPAEIPAAVRQLVDDRWLEYGLGPPP
jgi:4-hydroxy-3-polyprenylbenzoate decarboxylase